MEIVSRKDARSLGLKHYFTGVACKHGHVDLRYTDNLTCSECIRQRARKRQKDNADHVRAVCRKSWRKRSPWRDKAKDAAKSMRWAKNNPEKVIAITANRRARKLNNGGTHTSDDIIELLKTQRGKCVYCKVKLKKYHVDHIVPLARGGSNGRRNLQILCQPCNQRKSSRDPIEYTRSQGMLI